MTNSAPFLNLRDIMQQQMGKKQVLQFVTAYAVAADHHLYNIVEPGKKCFFTVNIFAFLLDYVVEVGIGDSED